MTQQHGSVAPQYMKDITQDDVRAVADFVSGIVANVQRRLPAGDDELASIPASLDKSVEYMTSSLSAILAVFRTAGPDLPLEDERQILFQARTWWQSILGVVETFQTFEGYDEVRWVMPVHLSARVEANVEASLTEAVFAD